MDSEVKSGADQMVYIVSRMRDAANALAAAREDGGRASHAAPILRLLVALEGSNSDSLSVLEEVLAVLPLTAEGMAEMLGDDGPDKEEDTCVVCGDEGEGGSCEISADILALMDDQAIAVDDEVWLCQACIAEVGRAAKN